MFCESIGHGLGILKFRKVVAFCDQFRFLCRRQFKDEISRKSLLIPFDLLVQPFGSHTLKACQIIIDNYLFAPNKPNPMLDLIYLHCKHNFTQGILPIFGVIFSFIVGLKP